MVVIIDLSHYGIRGFQSIAVPIVQCLRPCFLGLDLLLMETGRDLFSSGYLSTNWPWHLRPCNGFVMPVERTTPKIRIWTGSRWTDGKIQRANLDGVEDLITTGGHRGCGPPTTSKIQRANLDGGLSRIRFSVIDLITTSAAGIALDVGVLDIEWQG